MSNANTAPSADPRQTAATLALLENKYVGPNMRRLSIARRDFLFVLRAVREGRMNPEHEAIAFARLYDEL
ncbi:MAG: hypothetical protein WC655_18760 [Candidatus Hydrogenedentales bacterium]|jgi:hypothetical protein